MSALHSSSSSNYRTMKKIEKNVICKQSSSSMGISFSLHCGSNRNQRAVEKQTESELVYFHLQGPTETNEQRRDENHIELIGVAWQLLKMVCG